MNKKQRGQFYTTNSEYILQGLHIPTDVNEIIEPFVGSGELVEFAQKHYPGKTFTLFDIEPKYEKQTVFQRDTLLEPPCYNGMFVLTNPPYLARNKNADKQLYDLYNTNDLYKCFLKTLVHDTCKGGIIIIPLNFWCSTRNNDALLRKEFLNLYHVPVVNVFEERVFDDTSYTICSFSFFKKEHAKTEEHNISFKLFPSQKEILIRLEEPLWIIGQELYIDSNETEYKIKRWVIGDDYDKPNTSLILFALDDGRNNGKRIRLEISDIPYRGKESDRTKASLIILPELCIERQRQLVTEFTNYLENNREKYNSLFMCNYRESIDYARKRISFDLAYKIIRRLLARMN